MPFLTFGAGKIFFEDHGEGAPIIATHGFSENSAYWSVCGVGQRLAEDHRFIAMDMRGHGRTNISASDPGFDVETMADDLERLADHLKLDRFHLLGHATGSVVALRYAMRASPRLISLAVTSAASATAMISADPDENAKFFSNMARFYAENDWDQIVPRIKAKPWPFLHQLDRHPEASRLWDKIEAIFRACDTDTLGRFAASFYDDPDPQLGHLRAITAPTLVLISEHDDVMRGPSRQIADHVPDAALIDIENAGHMTALEAPDRLATMLIDFFRNADATNTNS